MPGSYSPFARRAYALPPARGYKPPTPSKGGGDIIRSIFADGTDGFYFDFSKTDRLFQDAVGTLADGAGENIYVGLESSKWQGRTLAQQIAAQTEIITPAAGPYASAPTGVSAPNGTVSIESGAVRATSPGAASCRLEVSFSATAGRFYKVTAALYSNFGIQPAAFVNATPSSLSVMSSGANTLDLIVYAPATGTLSLRLYCRSSNGANQVAGDYVEMSSFSIKEIPGNHGLQATTSAQPKWQTGGLARFDGSDDALVTTLTPATAMALMFKGKLKDVIGSSVFYVMGSRVTAGNDRFYLGFDNSGRLTTTIGGTTLTRTGSLEATVGVGAVVLSGGVGTLYWNAVDGASGAVGTPNTTVPFALGAINTSGTLSAFFKDDIYYALAIKKALTAAEIAAITNYWGTT